MIQRIQTLYLLLTIIISVLFLTGTIIGFSVNNEPAFEIKASGVYNTVNCNQAELSEKLIPLSAVSALIPLIFVTAIFLYKQRRIQNRAIITGIIVIIITIVLLSYVSAGIVTNNNAVIIPSIKMIYPPVMILLAVLASRAVQKDDRLVKSYDRLR